MKEWIEYHKIIGVQHFYMYDNCSDDDYRVILEPYISNGEVSLVDWPYAQSQLQAYRNCIDTYGKESQWLGFIDLDEFIVPIKCDFLKNFKKRGSVLIHWKIFGSSGIVDRDVKGLVTEDFQMCWPKYSDVGKCFLNTNYKLLDDKKNHIFHHFLWTEHNGKVFPPVNIFDQFCYPDMQIKGNKKFPIQINHYVTKSYGEYQKKMSKTDVFFEKNPHTDQMFLYHDEKCNSTDDAISKYINELKQRL
jgi:hypothetical protein